MRTAEMYDAEIEGLRSKRCSHICVSPPRDQSPTSNNMLTTHLLYFDPGTGARTTTSRPKIAWSPGHTDIDENERTDTICKQATEFVTLGPMRTTIIHARRAAKERILDAWTEQY